jgi:hypothetical protein
MTNPFLELKALGQRVWQVITRDEYFFMHKGDCSYGYSE